MLRRLADLENPVSWASRLRARRFSHVISLLAPLPPPITILDVGSSRDFWHKIPAETRRDWRITIINVALDRPSVPPDLIELIGSGLALPFPDQSFDLVFSNSVIEHVGSYADQSRMAGEIQRVGRR